MCLRARQVVQYVVGGYEGGLVGGVSKIPSSSFKASLPSDWISKYNSLAKVMELSFSNVAEFKYYGTFSSSRMHGRQISTRAHTDGKLNKRQAHLEFDSRSRSFKFSISAFYEYS